MKKFYELLKFHLKIVPSLTVNIGLFGVEKFHSPISVFFPLKNLYMLRVVIPFTSIPVIVMSYYSVYCHSFTFFFEMPYKRLRNREAHYPNSLAIVAGYRWLRCILSISAFHLVRRGYGLFQSCRQDSCPHIYCRRSIMVGKKRIFLFVFLPSRYDFVVTHIVPCFSFLLFTSPFVDLV